MLEEPEWMMDRFLIATVDDGLTQGAAFYGESRPAD